MWPIIGVFHWANLGKVAKSDQDSEGKEIFQAEKKKRRFQFTWRYVGHLFRRISPNVLFLCVHIADALFPEKKEKKD